MDDIRTLVGSTTEHSFVLYSFNTGKTKLASSSSSWPISLPTLGFEAIVVAPLLFASHHGNSTHLGVAAFGLIDKFNALAGVSSFVVDATESNTTESFTQWTVSVKCTGTLGLFVAGVDEHEAKAKIKVVAGEVELESTIQPAEGGVLVSADLNFTKGGESDRPPMWLSGVDSSGSLVVRLRIHV